MGWLSDENFQTPRKTVNSERDSFLIHNINFFGGERVKFLHERFLDLPKAKNVCILYSLIFTTYTDYRVKKNSPGARGLYSLLSWYIHT